VDAFLGGLADRTMLQLRADVLLVTANQLATHVSHIDLNLGISVVRRANVSPALLPLLD